MLINAVRSTYDLFVAETTFLRLLGGRDQSIALARHCKINFSQKIILNSKYCSQMSAQVLYSQPRCRMASSFTNSKGFLPISKPNCCRPIQRQLTVTSSLNTLSLHCGPTTIKVPVPEGQVETLAHAVNGLMKTFAEKQKAEKPRRWDTVECKINGEWEM